MCTQPNDRTNNWIDKQLKLKEDISERWSVGGVLCNPPSVLGRPNVRRDKLIIRGQKIVRNTGRRRRCSKHSNLNIVKNAQQIDQFCVLTCMEVCCRLLSASAMMGSYWRRSMCESMQSHSRLWQLGPASRWDITRLFPNRYCVRETICHRRRQRDDPVDRHRSGTGNQCPTPRSDLRCGRDAIIFRICKEKWERKFFGCIIYWTKLMCCRCRVNVHCC